MADYLSKTPPINCTGTYVLRAPFAQLIQGGTSYRTEAIDGFNALELKSTDVYATYYAPIEGLTINDYNRDKGLDANIVTLISFDHGVIYVPSTYILSYPNELSVPFGRLVIAVDLGPLPSDFYYENIRAEMQDIAYRETRNDGIVASVHFIPIPDFVSASAADSLLKSRFANVKDAISTYGAKIASDEQVSRLTEQVGALENIFTG